MISYLRNVGAGLSHLFNAVTGGMPRYSFSARVGSAQHRNRCWARPVAALIDAMLFSRNHCLEKAEEEGLIGWRRWP